jgi:nicotinamide mononucleotide adenylyltransferase
LQKNINIQTVGYTVLGMKNYKFPTKKLREGTPDAPRIVLVACGSYNPPTFLHLRLFEAARDKLEKEMGYEVIGGYMSPVHPAYGKTGLVSGEHRYNMCKRAVASSDWIDVDPWEIMQEGYTRTLPVLEHFDQEVKKALKNSNNVRVSLLCGADLVESFGIPNVWRTEDVSILLDD